MLEKVVKLVLTGSGMVCRNMKIFAGISFYLGNNCKYKGLDLEVLSCIMS